MLRFKKQNLFQRGSNSENFSSSKLVFPILFFIRLVIANIQNKAKYVCISSDLTKFIDT